MRGLAVVTTWALAAAAPVGAQDGLAILQRAEARYAPVASVCADFVEHLASPLLGSERTSRGRMCQARPDLFGMRYSDPAGMLLVADGEGTWYYTPQVDEKEVFRFGSGQGTGGRDFFREFLQDPGTKYDVTYEGSEALDGATMHRLRLVPKGRLGYERATLWIEDATSVLRRIRLQEENENVRTLTLSAVTFDGPTPPGFFEFTPPAGASVIRP